MSRLACLEFTGSDALVHLLAQLLGRLQHGAGFTVVSLA